MKNITSTSYVTTHQTFTVFPEYLLSISFLYLFSIHVSYFLYYFINNLKSLKLYLPLRFILVEEVFLI